MESKQQPRKGEISPDPRAISRQANLTCTLHCQVSVSLMATLRAYHSDTPRFTFCTYSISKAALANMGATSPGDHTYTTAGIQHPLCGLLPGSFHRVPPRTQLCVLSLYAQDPPSPGNWPRGSHTSPRRHSPMRRQQPCPWVARGLDPSNPSMAAGTERPATPGRPA